MAQFRGTVQGNRGGASRLGSKASGLRTTCNGWQSGVEVVASVNEETGQDEFVIWATGGSSPRFGAVRIGTVTTDADGNAVVSLSDEAAVAVAS